MKTLMSWRRPSGTMQPLRDEVEQFFERFLTPLDANGNGGALQWAPNVDVEETEKDVIVKADLPGVDPKDVEVTVVDGTLILRGEKKTEKEEKKKNFHRVERFVGQFYRQIVLPAGVSDDKITATSSKGVITVAIPKKPEAQPRKIAVKAQD